MTSFTWSKWKFTMGYSKKIEVCKLKNRCAGVCFSYRCCRNVLGHRNRTWGPPRTNPPPLPWRHISFPLADCLRGFHQRPVVEHNLKTLRFNYCLVKDWGDVDVILWLSRLKVLSFYLFETGSWKWCLDCRLLLVGWRRPGRFWQVDCRNWAVGRRASIDSSCGCLSTARLRWRFRRQLCGNRDAQRQYRFCGSLSCWKW